ncbi:unnamed protein product [Prunus armeniaca]
MDVTFIEDKMFFSKTSEHVLQGETRGATVEPVEPTMLDETTDLEETPALAKTTTLAKFELASFIDGAKPIPSPTSQIVPNQAPLDIPEYVVDLLADTEILDCKPTETAILENHKLEIPEVGWEIYLFVTDMPRHCLCESENRGIAQGVCEILWLRVTKIGFRPNTATKLHYDSQSAFEIANNPVQHD